MMDPVHAISWLQTVPYERGAGGPESVDCFGVVEQWYERVLGIPLTERGDIPPGHAGIQKGHERLRDWIELKAPEDHCMVTLRALRWKYGHVGIYYRGCLLHTDEATGCVFEPFRSRSIQTRVTGFYRHK